MVDEKYRKKIKTIDGLLAEIGAHPRDKKVIMCHGTFDIVHPGHIRHLIYSASKADLLVASLTADAHISKANLRPYVPEDLRALNLAALDMVDFVIIDPNATPLEHLAKIQPDYFAKGYEYISEGMPPKTKAEKDVLDSYGGEFIFTPGDVVYSSSRLIELAPPSLSAEKLAALLQAEGLSFDDLRHTLDRFDGKRVHVVGDTIIDSYTETTMIGGQTKTPTLSVRYEGRTDYVGGAGIVAKHLKSAGGEVVFSTVLGDDRDGELAIRDLTEAGVETRALIDPTRPTTNKNAIVCAGHRMIKVDTLDNRAISEDIQRRLHQQIQAAEADSVVFADFRHGIFNPETIPGLIAAIPDGTFRVADSQVASRWGNICEFERFDLITPNEREARFALGDQDSVVRPLALKLFQRARCRNLILKLGERGLIAYRQRADADQMRAWFTIDSFADHVVDAVGAGDALLAYATLAHVATGNPVTASVLGAMAAAVEVEHDGNVPVGRDDVLKKIDAVESRANYES